MQFQDCFKQYYILHIYAWNKFKNDLLSVVYFDQHLGAEHSKRWLKYAFLKLLTAKS